MSDHNLTIGEREQRKQLDNLNSAERVLRSNLHMHGLDSVARAHMERALVHVREAFIATNDASRARSVQQLVDDVSKVERLFEKVRNQHVQSEAGHGIKIS
jgi:hypothetical protein